MKTKKLKELKELIEKYYPDSLFHERGCIYSATSEFLVGTFAGRGFEGNTEIDALYKLWKYLTLHVGNNSIVGWIVTKSGWPDLDKVEEYLKSQKD